MAEVILYIKAEKNVEVMQDAVCLKDVAKMTCTNGHILNKAKTLIIYQFQKDGEKRQVISILKVIEVLQNYFPTLNIVSLGETDIIVELVKGEPEKQVISILKIVMVSLVCFFGTAFTIMAFHNDIGIDGVFTMAYEQVMGEQSSHYTVLEFCYSIGLAVGIIVFFNHIGGRRITKDPTPIEVEMKVYEESINKTLTEVWNREGKTIDVP